MKFNLKRNNYNNFDVYKDNVMKPRSYFIPFANEDELADNDFRTERYNSSRVDVLNGEWDFRYFEKASDVPDEIEIGTYEFDKVSVPSMWQFTGYEEPYYLNTRYQFKPNPPEIPADCPVGIYHRVFEIDDMSMNYTLSFLGVAGGLEVYVNGSYVGYSEGSHNTSEFEINEFVREGENHLVVVNHKWTNGTYLEAQDMFRNNGIFRDVLLYKTGSNSIYDFEIKTQCIDNIRYSLKIYPTMKVTDSCELSAFLYNDGELVASASANQQPGMAGELDFGELAVHPWSAECPYLYDLLLVLARDGEAVELVHRSIGFKTVKIFGNQFLFNDKGIKLFGVNHHDTNPKTGYVMTVEDMERDVRIFKEFNVNCVRTSHYPPDPIFLDLCDEYGIYVVDEADIEAHGCQTELHKPGACSHNPAWRDRYWDRVYRMYERDKNHPSITMWSLGNESWGYSNQDYCYQEIKKRSDIPVHYENVIRTRRFAYDVISEMYPWHKKFDKLAKGSGLPARWYRKPYFMCEYAHAMGFGAGELETYVSKFIEADNLMGGCIWEFADHAVYHENGKYKYTYGGDHGEEKHDDNFCVDGLFFPDRTPHSGAYQMKNCYRPVRASIGENKIIFRCLNYFEAIELTAKITALDENGNELDNSEFKLNIEPQKATEIDYDLNKYAIIIKYYNGDLEVASEQLEIGNRTSDFESVSEYPPKYRVSEKHRLFITLDNGQIIFNTRTGEMESYIVGGKEFINSAPFGNFTGIGASIFRAPIDNDRNIKIAWSRYKLESEHMYLKKCDYSIKNNCLKISCYYTISTISTKRLAEVIINYNIYADGKITVFVCCEKSKIIPFAPRFGAVIEMPGEFENVKYFGCGPLPNCDDFREHAMLGVYKMKVDDMREKYIKPQESSMRSGVRWFEITNDAGQGLRFDAGGFAESYIFSADHFTSQQCAKASHQEDLKLCNTTVIHIDDYMLGAGSAACGPVPSKRYRANRLKGMSVFVAIEPIGV